MAANIGVGAVGASLLLAMSAAPALVFDPCNSSDPLPRCSDARPAPSLAPAVVLGVSDLDASRNALRAYGGAPVVSGWRPAESPTFTLTTTPATLVRLNVMVTTRCQFPTTVLTTTTGVSSSTWRSGPLAFTNADHAAGCGAGGSILDKTVDAWALGQRRNVTTTTGRITLQWTPTTFVPRVNVTEAASDTDTGVFVFPGDKLEIVDLGTGPWSGGNAQIWAGYWFRDSTNGNGLIDSCSREIANPYGSVSFFNNPSVVLDVRGEPFQPLFYDNSACNAGADYPIARGAAKDMLIAGTAGGWQTAVGAFRRFTWQGPAGHLHLRTNDNQPG